MKKKRFNFNLYNKTARDFLINLNTDQSLNVGAQNSEDMPEKRANCLRVRAQKNEDRQENRVNCLTVTVGKGWEQNGWKQGFDTLLNRKY